MPLETLPAVLEHGDWLVVAGLFDPLTAGEARRLASLANHGHKLMVIVLNGEDPLLSVEARAPLVAGLRDVSAVCAAATDEWRKFIPRTPRVRLVEDTQADRARTADFIGFVLNRQNV